MSFRVRATLIGGVALLGVVSFARSVHASCNAIPGATEDFRAALGTVDRPFASPDDFVALRVRPSVCDAESAGFSPTATDHVLTFVFDPPGTAAGAPGPHNVVVVAANCSALATAVEACDGRPDVARAVCLTATEDPLSLEVRDVEGERLLFVRFPNTDDLLPPAGDDRTLSGPVKIAVKNAAVTPVADRLACELVAERCATTTSPGLVACVDELFALDGTCRTGADNVDRLFGHFTALPPPNRFQDLCTEPGEVCTGTATEARLTTDREGNLFIPVNWEGVLVEQDGTPVPRLIDGQSAIPAFLDEGIFAPIRIPGNRFVDSYAPGGQRLPAIFDPQFDSTSPTELALFGSADAPRTILRLARRSFLFQECDGGDHHGLPCVEPADCPSGTCRSTTCFDGGVKGETLCSTDTQCVDTTTDECGPALFEFRDRYADQVGPVIVSRVANSPGVCEFHPEQFCDLDLDPPVGCPDAGERCVDFRAAAQVPVPLEGLAGTREIFAFSRSEPMETFDLNGDGDAEDPAVVDLRDRRTGESLPIGPNGALGRAVTLLRETPHRFPALAVESDRLTFLEPEIFQEGLDANGNGLVGDQVVRSFRGTLAGADEVTDSLSPPTADAALLVNRRSLALSQGRTFFRSPESGVAGLATTIGSLDAAGGQTDSGSAAPALSADGRHLAFASWGTNVTPDDTNGHCDVFVRDRVAGTTTLVSMSSSGDVGDQSSGLEGVAISADGRYVAFVSRASNLVPGDTNDVCAVQTTTPDENCVDVFVHDRDADGDGVFDEDPGLDPGSRRTVRVSVDSNGNQSNGNSGIYALAISADGRYVAFASQASNLVPGDTNNSCDNRGSDGTFDGILDDNCSDVFVHDRDADADGIYDETQPSARSTVRVSVDSDGNQGNGASGFEEMFTAPVLGLGLSPDGRYVAFGSFASNLVAGDTNDSCDNWGDGNGDGNADDNCADLFIHDRLTGSTERLSVSAPGHACANDAQCGVGGFCDDGLCVWQGLGDSGGTPGISGDGRYVAFISMANELVPNDGIFCDENGDGVPDITCADVFVRDRCVANGVRVPRCVPTTEIVSVDSLGNPGNEHTYWCSISADGRYVVVASLASNLVAGDTNGFADVFRHDRLTRTTTRVSVDSNGAQGNGQSVGVVAGFWGAYVTPTNNPISADGRLVAFVSTATNFVATDTNGDAFDIFVRAADTTDPDADLTGDGGFDDDLLTTLEPNGVLRTLCPADTTSVANGQAAFLRPEPAGKTPDLPVCPTGDDVDGKWDLNGDGDALDRVAHLFDGASVTNLHCAAEDVSLSSTHVAVLVSEAGDGHGSLNGDTDADDLVVHVLDLTDDPPAACGDWTNVGQAADTVDVSGGHVAFITPEAAQGTLSAASGGTRDGDLSDRVFQVYSAGVGLRTPADADGRLQPAEEFVMGAEVVALRSRETDMCDVAVDESACDPNPPGCPLEQCDLNQDGDCCDDVLQAFDLVTGDLVNSRQAVRPCTFAACDPDKPYRVSNATVKFLTHECEQGGSTFNVGCPGGGTDLNLDGDALDLVVQVLKVRTGAVTTVATVDDQSGNLIDPLQGDPLAAEEGTQVFVSSGRCLEDRGTSCTTDADCASGEFCDEGVCARDHGPCADADDCPGAAACEPEPVVAASADSDQDGVADALDDCPEHPDVNQEDTDGDGVGDACDLQTCGNGTTELDEVCDDGNLVDGDECDSNCTFTACGNGVVTGDEECDDANVRDSDGCTRSCAVEDGWLCSWQPSLCTTICGDGVVLGAEECDDGNTADGDGCSSACLVEFIAVAINVKPSSDENTVQLGSAGVIPVAILGAVDFDATVVNPATVVLAGAAVRLRGQTERQLCSEKDVNGDGFVDLLCQVETDKLSLEVGETLAVLEGRLYDGTRIRGEDYVRIVP